MPVLYAFHNLITNASVYKGPLVVLYDIEGTDGDAYAHKGTPCVHSSDLVEIRNVSLVLI